GHYFLYGQPVRSEIPLPPPPTARRTRFPAVTFRRGRGAAAPEGAPAAVRRGTDGKVLSERYRDRAGEWIRHANVGLFHITPDLRTVWVYADPGVSDEFLGLVLIGQISTFLLGKHGFPCLHASAVIAEGRTAAFLGTNGQGKSTMAGSFLARGATLLTDDALPLHVDGETVYGAPGVPLMKMWSDTANSLAISETLPNLPLINKKLLILEGRYPFAAAPARLDGLFILSRYQTTPGDSSEVSLTRLSERDALTAMLAQTSWNMLLTREEVARLLPFYAGICRRVPVWLLQFPHGYEHQDAIHLRVLRELSQL
ncbi:MAG: hypothetical protein ACO1SX_24305, partial [Actinomycetota bacterium]